MAYAFAVPGGAAPQAYSSCWLPPAAYSHSAWLGKKPPSQMQNAYASAQFTQLIGRFSLPPIALVHVGYGSLPPQPVVRFAVVGSRFALSDATQPGSYVSAPP